MFSRNSLNNPALRTLLRQCCLCLVGVIFTMQAAIAAPLKDGETATLNMENTDIRTLITTVADKTGTNFIVDPRVKGKVTVISHKPAGRDEIYQIFLSILEVHGFAAVPSGNAIKIIPDNTAKQSSIPTASTRVPGRGDEIVTRVYQVEYVNAQQMVPILRPLIPQQGHLAAYAGSNVLIISDRADNISRIVKIIRRIDQPDNNELEVIPLQYASAADLVRIITTLNQQGGAKPPAGGVQDKPVVVADERTNSILLGGGKASRLRIRAIISHLDTPTETGGNTQVVYLRYAEATDLVSVLTSVSSSIGKDAKKGAKGAASAGGTELNIQADENTNALVITAPPELMRSLLDVIKKLDVRRAQVLVEAVIAEVSSTKVQELGIQFRGNDNGNFGVSGFSSGVVDSINTAGGTVTTTENSSTPAAISVGSGLTLGSFRSNTSIFGTGLNLSVLVRALGTDNDTNVLSTPSLVTLDNQEAEIVVGQNVPFVTGTQQTTGGLANPFQTIQRQDVGLTLKVKPQINEGNTIKLDIEQETSNVDSTNTSGASDIITNKRSIKTTVLVDDANIVVLGGLIMENLQESVQKVPLLGDLPLVGHLFKSSSGTKGKTNLMVFLRPVILRDSVSNKAQASQKYEYIRGEQIKAHEDGVVQLPDDVAPKLPTLDKFLELPPPFEEVSQEQSPADEQADTP